MSGFAACVERLKFFSVETTAVSFHRGCFGLLFLNLLRLFSFYFFCFFRSHFLFRLCFCFWPIRCRFFLDDRFSCILCWGDLFSLILRWLDYLSLWLDFLSLCLDLLSLVCHRLDLFSLVCDFLSLVFPLFIFRQVLPFGESVPELP